MFSNNTLFNWWVKVICFWIVVGVLALMIFGFFLGRATAAVTRTTPNAPIVRARRYAVTTSWAVMTINSGKIQLVKCRNYGANPVRMNFNSDIPANFWSAAANEEFPEIKRYPALVINVRSVGGASNLECFLQSGR